MNVGNILLNTLTAVTEAETTLSSLEEDLAVIADLPQSAEEANIYLRQLLTMLQEFAVTYGGKLIVSLILLILGFKCVNVLTSKLFNAKALKMVEKSTRGFIKSLVGVFLKLVIGMTALAILGIPMSSMIAIIGSCGLAIGLALQGSLANIAGGFILLLFHPFRVGDYITSGDISGTVSEIGIFYTKVKTNDNRTIVVPNSAVSNATLVNVTGSEKRRVDFVFCASYDDDIDKVEEILKQVCRDHELTYDDPEPFARLSAHGDSALEYTVRVWCDTENYWSVYYDITKQVKKAFDENGISIPYPQVDVHSDK